MPTSTSAIFSRFLDRKRTSQGIGFSDQSDAVSLLQQFNLAGMDYQGQVSSGYGYSGVKSTVEASINILDFIVPLIPLPGLILDINVGLTGSILKELFVLLQRYPKVLYNQNEKPIWETKNPICLLGLEGVSGEITLQAGVGAGAEIPFPSLGDELGIEVSAKAGVSGQLKGKIIRLSGSYTGAFPSPSDSKLQSYNRLNQIVAQMFSPTDKNVLKENINKWIDGVVIGWLQPNAVKDRKRDRTNNAVKDKLGRFSERLSKSLGPSENSVFLRLAQLETAVNEPSVTLTEEEKNSALRQIAEYRDLLSASYSRIDPVSLPGLRPADESFFHLFSFAVGAEASAKAVAEAWVEPPTIPWAGLDIRASGGVGGLAKATVEIQRIAYRYQSRLDGSVPLLFTQDNWITYRRTHAEAKAFAEVELTPLSLKKGAEAEAQLAYQSMNYISTALYWIPPVTEPRPPVIPLRGSGLRIGISVSARRLIRYANGPSSAPNKISDPICKNLFITVEQLKKLIDGAELPSLKEDQEGFPKYLFLEAAFTFPDKFSVGWSKGKHYAPDSRGAELLLADPKLNERLQSLRLRIRISDAVESETQLYKLGFPVIQSGLNVDLSRVRGTGQEGMYDYYVHWFSNPDLNTDPQAALAAQETSIPPVVLLHQ